MISYHVILYDIMSYDFKPMLPCNVMSYYTNQFDVL